MRRSAFSTMMTAPSTMRPKSSAPRLIRFADTPARSIPKLVRSMVIGITSAAISAARKLPSNRKSTTITSSAPSVRFLPTVQIVELTSLVRSRTGSMTTSGGSDALVASSRSATAVATARLFSPMRMIAVPTTTSVPFSDAEPMRTAWPVRTLATWSSVIGTPDRVATTTRDSSAVSRMSASERTASPSPLRSTTPPPTLVLLRSSASARSVRLRSSAASLCTSGTTIYCFE